MAAMSEVPYGGPSGPLVDLLSSIMGATGGYQETKERKRTSRKAPTAHGKDEELEEALADLKSRGVNEEHARCLLKQLAVEEKVVSQDDEHNTEDESLVQCVRGWMLEHTRSGIDQASLQDFNLNVRFQGHEVTTPPDHLSAMLHVLACQSCDALAASADSRQPVEMARVILPLFSKWSPLVGELYHRCDVLDVTDILASSLCDGIVDARGELSELERDTLFVGIVMAMRDAFSFVADDDLIAACHQLDSESQVVEKVIEFLQADSESSDEDETPSWRAGSDGDA